MADKLVDLIGIGNLLESLVAEDIITCEERDRVIAKIARENDIAEHMFSGEEPVAAKKKATKIVKKLNANNKSHSRHFTVDFCKELGLNITELESDQTLQELVLSVHHAFIITIDATAATKLIENQNGARYITSQKK